MRRKLMTQTAIRSKLDLVHTDRRREMDKLMELKTNATLLAALGNASSKKQTADEIRAQRVSFILGSMDEKSGVTKSRIQKVLEEQQGIGS